MGIQEKLHYKEIGPQKTCIKQEDLWRVFTVNVV